MQFRHFRHADSGDRKMTSSDERTQLISSFAASRFARKSLCATQLKLSVRASSETSPYEKRTAFINHSCTYEPIPEQ